LSIGFIMSLRAREYESCMLLQIISLGARLSTHRRAPTLNDNDLK
jgi:hypothetical protein